jgi:hypothetical protein
MGLTKGDRGQARVENDLSPWVSFTICPQKFRQDIWLAPKVEEKNKTKRVSFDSKTWRCLTPEIEGSLSFVTGRLAIIEDVSELPTSTIGTLAYSPAFHHAEYGHAESYHIEINLNEKDFNHIRDIFLGGRSPSVITISTPDVEFGNSPNGSEKIWKVLETEYSTYAKITGFSMAFSTDIPRIGGIGLKKTENEEESEREETEKIKTAILHSREDIQLLCYQQAALNTSFGGLRKQMNTLISVAVAIAVVTAIAAFHIRF